MSLIILGPCAGKTQALDFLRKELLSKGFKVYSVAEASTLLLTNGGKYPGLELENRPELLAYEEILIRLQLSLEESIHSLSKLHPEKAVIICDRGIADVQGYVPSEVWVQLMNKLGLSNDILLARYDLVVHLVTAANGAESFFGNETNISRRETAEEARHLDKVTFSCWFGHPHHYFIKNDNTYFPGKLNRMLETVLLYLQNLYKN